MVVFSAHGVAPSVHENAAEAPACARSTRPARWSPRSTSRRASSPSEGYTIVLIGHEGHEEVEGTTGEAPEQHRPGPDGVRRRRARGRRSRPDRLHHPDDPLGRRDQLDHRAAAREVPERGRAEDRRHLLRDDEPPGRGQGAGPGVRPRPRHRVHELVKLEPTGRGRPRARRRLLPDRQPSPGRRGLARGHRDGRHHLGRERAGGAGRAAGRLLPRARRRRRLRAARPSTRTSASCSRARSARNSPAQAPSLGTPAANWIE